MGDTTITDRGRRRASYVLVVHDRKVDVDALCRALKTHFVTRVVDNAFLALERLSEPNVACVVCVLGGAIRAAEFFDLATRVAPAHTARLAFINARTKEDVAFLLRSPTVWLPHRAKLEDTVRIVTAVSALRK
jgi:hypothetical protein